MSRPHGDPFAPFRLDGRVALITGASSGFGRGCAAALTEVGATVVLGARREDRLHDVAEEVRAVGGQALPVVTDVTDPDSCQRMVDQAMTAFDRVDVLINSAGTGTAVPATRETPEQFRAVVDINLFGTYWMAQAFARHATTGSVIVNISSTLALRSQALPQAAYVSSKTALLGLTRDLAVQWSGRKGIRVNAMAPGYFESDLSDALSPDARARVTRAAPIGRIATVEELMPTLVYLCSDASAFMTGAVLTIDGGISL